MNDLERTKRCAEAMGLTLLQVLPEDERLYLVKPMEGFTTPQVYDTYWPLHNDAQAMALLKAFPVECISALDGWVFNRRGVSMNRAIMECVAQMQAIYDGR